MLQAGLLGRRKTLPREGGDRSKRGFYLGRLKNEKYLTKRSIGPHSTKGDAKHDVLTW